MAQRVGSRPKKSAPVDLGAAAGRLAAIIGHGAQGAALARVLAREGARTRADLKKPGVLARLPRESQASVLFSPVRSVPLADAQAVAAEVRRRLVFAGGDSRPRRLEVVPVGSVRRRAPRVKDLDFLVVLPAAFEGHLDRALASAAFRAPRAGDRLELADTYSQGARRRSLILHERARGRARARNFRVDLFLATAEERPYALFHFTGSFKYNIRTRAYAKRKGWLLNQYGLFQAATSQRVRGTAAIRTERDLAKFLGVSFRAPTDRER
jgi:DNA polymerase/3'-5' exonuclease PolX